MDVVAGVTACAIANALAVQLERPFNCNVKTIAAAARVSGRTVERFARQALGTTPKTLLAAARWERALAEDDGRELTSTVLARALGLGDPRPLQRLLRSARRGESLEWLAVLTRLRAVALNCAPVQWNG